jgi:pimeloyl-ACP methyl ester carboxylesterase
MYCRIHDIDIYYKTIGSGVPIIMLHGWGPDHRLLEGCMEGFFKRNKYKRVYFDLPGLGKTKGNEWLTSSDKMLELIIDFINKIIPEKKFLLVGESYGGYIARALVNRMPEKIIGMLLICPLARHETQFQNAPKHCVTERDEAFLNKLSEEEKAFMLPATTIQTKRIWKRFKNEVLSGLKIADFDYINSHWGKNAPFSFDIDDIKSPFNGPVLILMGKQDSMVGYTDSWEYIKNYPRASFVVLDKASHNLQIEQSKMYKVLVKEWLERVDEYISINGV